MRYITGPWKRLDHGKSCIKPQDSKDQHDYIHAMDAHRR